MATGSAASRTIGGGQCRKFLLGVSRFSLEHFKHRTAIFRQINKEVKTTHHDALEFPDGQIVLLAFLYEGQQATVLQLPIAQEGVKEPKREKARAS
jgi:hypothetical protein